MGLLDSNKFNFKNSSYVGTVDNVSANSYINGFTQVDVQSANSIAIVISGVAESNCQILLKGGIDTSVYNTFFLYNANGEKISSITGNGTYYADVSSANYIGLQSVNAMASITVKIKSLSNGDFLNHLAQKNVMVGQTTYSINKIGNIVTIQNKDKAWLCLNIELTTAANMCDLSIGASTGHVNGIYSWQYIYDFEGNILDRIQRPGIYYVNISSLRSFSIYSITAKDNSAKISYELTDSEPPVLNLKPIQVIYQETRTLTAGASAANFEINAERFFQYKNLFQFFKFYYICVRYIGANNAYKIIPLTISTLNRVGIVGGQIQYEPIIVRASKTSYLLNTEDWIPVTCGPNGMRVTIGLADGTSTIEAGDTLYFEIRGLR